MSVCSSLDIDRLSFTNTWTLDESGPFDMDSRQYLYIIDQGGRLYFNKSDCHIRFICALAAIGSLTLHTVGLVNGLAYRTLRVLSFYAFWKKAEPPFRSELNFRFNKWATDVVRILLFPFAIPCLFLSAIYGLVRPRDGRKLHGGMEFLFHGYPFIANCMHPRERIPAIGSSPAKISFSLPLQSDWKELKTIQTMSLEICFLLPFIVVLKTIVFISLYSLWRSADNATMSTRCWDWLKDGMSILSASLGIPFTFVALAVTFCDFSLGNKCSLEVGRIFYGLPPNQNKELPDHFLGWDPDEVIACKA